MQSKLSFQLKKHLFFSYIYTACSHLCTLGVYLSIFLKFSFQDVSMVAFLLVTKSVAYFISDIPAGILSDKIKSGYFFAIFKIIKIISLLLLLNQYYIIGIFLYGTSLSSNHGKINTYLYQILQQGKQSSYHKKTISHYYLFCHAVLLCSSPLALFIFKASGDSFEALIYSSIALTALALITLCFMPNIKNSSPSKNKPKASVEIKNWTRNLGNLHLLINGAVVYLLMWQYGNFFSTSLNALNVSPVIIVLSRNFLFFIATTASFFSSKITLSLNSAQISKILLLNVLLICLSFLGPKYLSAAALTITLFTMPFLSSNNEAQIVSKGEKAFLHTIASTCTTISTSINIALTLFLGYNLKHYPPATAIYISLTPLLIIILAANLLSILDKKNKNDKTA